MKESGKDKLVIVIPAYNEEKNLENVVLSFCCILSKIGNGSRLLLIDDGSTDRTWEKIKILQRKYPCVHGITKENQGHGATVLYGYRKALEEHADYIFQTDSDGQTLPEEFWQLWEAREQGGLLIGSRKKRQDGWQRVFVTRVLRLVIWRTFGCWVEDANTPFRLMKGEELKEIMEEIPENYPLANVLMTVLYIKKQKRVTYFPITFRKRQGGINSIHMKRIVQIGVSAWKDFKRMDAQMKKDRKEEKREET